METSRDDTFAAFPYSVDRPLCVLVGAVGPEPQGHPQEQLTVQRRIKSVDKVCGHEEYPTFNRERSTETVRRYSGSTLHERLAPSLFENIASTSFSRVNGLVSDPPIS